MPWYEFTCKQCGEDFSLRTSIKEKEQAKCPQCGSGDLQQKFGASVIFSGSSSSSKSCQVPPGGFS